MSRWWEEKLEFAQWFSKLGEHEKAPVENLNHIVGSVLIDRA
jgi:hypothetical protein